MALGVPDNQKTQPQSPYFLNANRPGIWVVSAWSSREQCGHDHEFPPRSPSRSSRSVPAHTRAWLPRGPQQSPAFLSHLPPLCWALTKAHGEHRNGSPWAAGLLTRLGVEEQKHPGQPHLHLCGAACPGPAPLRLQAGHELALGLAAWAAWWRRAPRPTGCGDRERRPNKAILTLR